MDYTLEAYFVMVLALVAFPFVAFLCVLKLATWVDAVVEWLCGTEA